MTPQETFIQESQDSFLLVLPLMVLVLTGLAAMLLDAFKAKSALPWVTGAGMLLSMITAFPPVYYGIMSTFGVDPNLMAGGEAFFGMYGISGLNWMVFIFLCCSGLFTLFFVTDYMKRMNRPVRDVYSLIIFGVVGMAMLANATHLIITFIGLETMSICLYVMAAMFKTESGSNESGLKYFLLGAFATGFFLYGIALIYGGSGSMHYGTIARNWDVLAASGMLLPGFGLLLIGFLFKVSAFPFHQWTPDVYTGAPTPLAGFMATGSKAAAFIALGAFLQPVTTASASGVVLGAEAGTVKILYVIIACALLSMVYGNIVAAQQKNLKRMLAYSSIAHSGYIMLALCAGREGYYAMIFYVFIYTLMNVGAFGMIGMAESRDDDNGLDSWKGLGMNRPWFGAGLSIFLLSMAGIPPLAGFFAKYFVFLTSLNTGPVNLIPVAIVGILTSVIGAYYYLRVIVSMFFEKPVEPLATTRSLAPVIGVALLCGLIILLGVFPRPVQSYITDMYSVVGATLAGK